MREPREVLRCQVLREFVTGARRRLQASTLPAVGVHDAMQQHAAQQHAPGAASALVDTCGCEAAAACLGLKVTVPVMVPITMVDGAIDEHGPLLENDHGEPLVLVGTGNPAASRAACVLSSPSASPL